MVIKTDVCSFSEYRVYPGHGMRFIRRDGTALILSSSKTKGLLNQRKKPAKLKWTQGWRRLHKKIKVEELAKRRTRRTTKYQRAIVGASLDEIRKKRAQKPTERSAQREAALKEVKERAKAMKAKQAAAKKQAVGGGATGSKQASKQKAAPKARGTQR
jgi:large subunit ribosomal protein L24e